MSVLKVKKDIIISIAASPIMFFETFKTEPVATQENMRIVTRSRRRPTELSSTPEGDRKTNLSLAPESEDKQIVTPSRG